MAHIPTQNGVITIKAILTQQGKRKIAQGASNFNITKFAVADDQMDYNIADLLATLQGNPQQYKILQPIMNGSVMLKNKLYTILNTGNISSDTEVHLVKVSGLVNDGLNLIDSDENTPYRPYSTNGISQTYNITFKSYYGAIPLSNISYRNSNDVQASAYVYNNNTYTINIPTCTEITIVGREITKAIQFDMTIKGNISGLETVYRFKMSATAPEATS